MNPSELDDIIRMLHPKHKSGVCLREKSARQAIKDLFDKLVNGMYELSITDLELREYQQGVEIPVISKTELRERIKAL